MAAAWQASGTLLGALTTADVTPVIPAHQTDDILIVLTSHRVITETCATPSGWTLQHGPIDIASWRTYVFWKRATSGAETDPLCDWTAVTGGDKYAQVHTVRGAITTGNPFAASACNTDSTEPYVTNGVTSTLDGQTIIVAGIGNDNLPTLVTVTSTDPAAYTEHHYSDIGTGGDAAGWFASATRATAGATGSITTDFDAALDRGAVFVAAVLDPPASVAITGNGGTGGFGTFAASVVLALSGVVGTGSIGTLAPSASYSVALTGEAGTGAPGSVAAGVAVPFSGEAGTGAVGTLVPESGVTVPLGGNAGTGEAGNLTPSVSVALQGHAGTGAEGSLAPNSVGGAALVGNQAIGSAGTLTASVAAQLSGVAGTGSVGTLVPTVGFVAALAGEGATGTEGTLIASVSVALSGSSALGEVGTLTPPSGAVHALSTQWRVVPAEDRTREII